MTQSTGLVWWDGERIDPAKNCYRWYRVWIQPDLFGVWAVWTAWGRIGSLRYRQRLYPTAGPVDAEHLAHGIIQRKVRRGYQPRRVGPPH